MSTGLFYDPLLKRHQTGDHPECPERLDAIARSLITLRNLTPIPTRPASDNEILLVHTPDYLQTVKDDSAANAGHLSTGDTVLSEHSLEVARHATGGVLNAVDAVITGQLQNAFCALRPPGHHATPDRGMGFCIFNHIAIAARYAQQHHGIAKVLIVDWDVHHGNGTQDAFYPDDSVLFFSAHQHPWYPGTGRRNETGRGPALGTTINAPLPAGSGLHEILGEIESRLEPALQKFKPELILLSAGFDSRLDDPLGRFTLTYEDFAALTTRTKQWAKDYSQNRLISLLEGGYNLETLGGAVSAHVKALQHPI
jgi:acetoin utilization deacetylase AcuC-like enzyme